MMMRKVLLLFVILILVIGCKKDNINGNRGVEVKPESIVNVRQGNAEIEIIVSRHDKNFFGVEEVGAEVSLYKKWEDAINDKDKIITATTDINGNCRFLGLKGGEYFVRVFGADCFNNLNDLIKYESKNSKIKAQLRFQNSNSDVIHIYQTTTFQIFNDLDEEVKVVFENQTALLAFMRSEIISPKSSVWVSVNKSGILGYSKRPEMVVYKVGKDKKYSVRYKSLSINIEDMRCEGNQFRIRLR